MVLERRHDLERVAPSAPGHAVQLLERQADVALVEGVGQLPGRHAATLAEEGLDLVDAEPGTLAERSGERRQHPDQALRVVTRGGSISLLGIFGEPPTVDLSELVIMKGLRLHGIFGRRIYDTWERTQSLLRGGLDVSPIITHRIDLADWQQAFDLIATRHAGKVVLIP